VEQHQPGAGTDRVGSERHRSRMPQRGWGVVGLMV
jgi:hypothetical protein